MLAWLSVFFVGLNSRHIDRQLSLNIQLAAGIRTTASDTKQQLRFIEDVRRPLDTVYRLVKIW